MLTAPPPLYQRARDAAPADVGRLQAHFVSHQWFRLLDMHTVIQPGTDRDGAAAWIRPSRLPRPAHAQQGRASIDERSPLSTQALLQAPSNPRPP